MGRNAAGESFLRGFLTHSKSAELWVQVQNAEHAQHFQHSVKTFAGGRTVKVVDKHSLGALAQAGVVYYPGPGIAEHAWQRANFGISAWSLCGITHTTSSAGAMDALAALVTAPVQPWDAVVCTSRAVKNNVEKLFQAQFDYLIGRLGIQKLVLPQLPMIPLGIHVQDFTFTAAQKAAARVALGVNANTLVVLFMGRLSFHAKAHPLAMYQALETAVKNTGLEVVLVECGWHANEFIEKAYTDAARLACPSVEIITLDGRKPEARRTAWAGADIFCSLSDNIQETFGIAPIEAMAAGLPLVVSDWDGYKDTVRDGIDGFRIPTRIPEGGLGRDLALRHALEIDTYDMYCGHTCSLVAVDVEATAQALIRLFSSPHLRYQMGAAGRERARTAYDWAAILPLYEALWAQLGEIREVHHKNLKPLSHPWPARMDPFHAFASYATQRLTAKTLLDLVDADVETAIARTRAYQQLAMVDFAKVVIPREEEIQSVLQAASTGPRLATELIASIPSERQAAVFRSLAWFLKLGILRVVDKPH